MAPTTRTSLARQDTWRITLTIHDSSGSLATGVWDKKTGGMLDSDELKYTPGGLAETQSLGGKKNPANVTLQRAFDRVDDSSMIARLLAGAGIAKATVTQTPLDVDGNAYGRALQWSGKLKSVAYPDTDSEGNAAALMEVEISTSTVDAT